MATQIALEILLILLLVAANGVFAMAEIAIVSARKARLRADAEHGKTRAKVALDLAENPNDFLSTVQIGITLVGILAGVFGGATITEQLAQILDTIPRIAPHGETVALAIVVLAITYLSLIIGELVPKRIALANPERIAVRLAPLMRTLARLARPAVWFLGKSSAAIVKLLRVRESKEQHVTEEELTSLLELGRRTGEFHPAEEEMIKGVFALGDRTARSVMTPRMNVEWLDLAQPAEALQKKIIASEFSRFPAAEHTLDNFIGVVEVKALLADCLSGRPMDLRAAVREPIVFPETASALQILNEFQQRKTEFGIVIDEYGGFEGIVTVSDLATRVLGLEDEEDTLVRRPDGSWLVDARIDLDDLSKRIGMEVGAADETLAGLVLGQLGRVPRIADHVESGGLRFEIVDMDGHRIDRILVTKLPSEEE